MFRLIVLATLIALSLQTSCPNGMKSSGPAIGGTMCPIGDQLVGRICCPRDPSTISDKVCATSDNYGPPIGGACPLGGFIDKNGICCATKS